MQKKYFVEGLVILFLILVFALININIFGRFLNIFILSYIAVKLLHPIYSKLLRRTKSVALSTTVSYILILFFLIIPIVIVLILVINEASTIATNIQFSNFIENFGQLQLALNNLINNINTSIESWGINYSFAFIDLSSAVSSINSSSLLQNQLIPLFRNIATFSGEFIFGFFLFTVSTLFLFPIFDKLPQVFAHVSPLKKKYDILLFTRFNNAIQTVIAGSIGVAILQASAALLPLLVIGVGAPVLLWVLMLLLSIVPVGSGLVWGPIGIAYIINGLTTANTGNLILGLFIIIYSAIIINVVDAYFRPKFMKAKLGLHPIVLIFSAIGGIGAFGIAGILFGPLAVVLFLTLLEIYKDDYHIVDDEELESNFEK